MHTYRHTTLTAQPQCSNLHALMLRSPAPPMRTGAQTPRAFQPQWYRSADHLRQRSTAAACHSARRHQRAESQMEHMLAQLVRRDGTLPVDATGRWAHANTVWGTARRLTMTGTALATLSNTPLSTAAHAHLFLRSHDRLHFGCHCYCYCQGSCTAACACTVDLHLHRPYHL